MTCRVTQLLQRLIAGDRDAAAWLYDTFALRLYRRLRLRYDYPGGLDAYDLLHDAYLLLYRDNGKLLQGFLHRVAAGERSEARLERFLWDQACGLASNRLRAAARRKAVVSLDEVRDAPAESMAEQTVLDRDTVSRMIACLRQRRQRIFLYFTLRYGEGLSPEEICEVTGWSRKATYKLRQAVDTAVRECAESLGVVQG